MIKHLSARRGSEDGRMDRRRGAHTLGARFRRVCSPRHLHPHRRGVRSDRGDYRLRFEQIANDTTDFFHEHPEFHIAINISPKEINSPRINDRLEKFIKGVSGAKAHNFIVEPTERSFIHPEQVRGILQKMRQNGVRVAIDDFGTGYSSLAYLQALNVDFIKIDKSFVDAIDTASVKKSVTLHIIELVRDLDLDVIAEGVERPEQAKYLHDNGVAYAQGWHFSKPITFAMLRSGLEQAARQTRAEIAALN